MARRLASFLLFLAGAGSAAAALSNWTVAEDLNWNWYNNATLKPSDINGSFAREWAYLTDGPIYADPIVRLAVPDRYGSLIIATMANSVYSFYLNGPKRGKLRWRKNFGLPFTQQNFTLCNDIRGDQGILSKPVLDDSGSTLYFVTKGWANTDLRLKKTAEYRVWAISTKDGSAVWAQPTALNGTKADNVQWKEANEPAEYFPTFEATMHTQRVDLALLNGQILIFFSGVCDFDVWYGWLITVAQTNGAVTNAWAAVRSNQLLTTADGGFGIANANPCRGTAQASCVVNRGGGIWAGGGKPLILRDEKAIFITVGNGYQDMNVTRAGNDPPPDVPETLIRMKFDNNGKIRVEQFFLPCDAKYIDDADSDISGSGVVGLNKDIFPEMPTNLAGQAVLFHGGKDGPVYYHDSSKLGGYCQVNKTSINDSVNNDVLLQTDGIPLYTQQSAARLSHKGETKTWTYFPGAGARPTGQLTNNPYQGVLWAQAVKTDAQNKMTFTDRTYGAVPIGQRAGTPLITSNGTDGKSAILWMITAFPTSQDSGELRAYSAVPTDNGELKLLWRYPIGARSKFVPPATDGSTIYMGQEEGWVMAFSKTKSPPPGQPAPASSTGNGQYVGCYNDQGGVLPAGPLGALQEFKTIIQPIMPGAQMDVATCVKACQGPDGNGLFGVDTYAGLKGGSGCFCGSTFGWSATHSIFCTMPCAGAPDQICGGPNQYSVYRTNPPNPKTIYDGTPLGCYKDNSTIVNTNAPGGQLVQYRDLGFNVFYGSFAGSHTTMSVGAIYSFMSQDLCVQSCGSYGFRFAGLQQGTGTTECWCGNTYGSLGSLPESSCSNVCPRSNNANDRNCGGVNANWVLAVRAKPPAAAAVLARTSKATHGPTPSVPDNRVPVPPSATDEAIVNAAAGAFDF